MISNDLKNELKKKFNLTDSIINSSKHYNIPKFVVHSKSIKYNKYKYYNIYKTQVVSLKNYLNDKTLELNNLSKTKYLGYKRENIYKLLTKIQREKIDLLINRAYHRINDNIRKYNKGLIILKDQKESKLDFLPLVHKQEIIEHVMNKAEKYLPLINKKYDFMRYKNTINEPKINEDEKFTKQYTWSHNFLEQKKLEDYKKIYKIKHINNEPSIKLVKYKNVKIQKDFDSPKRNKKYSSIPKNTTHSTINYSQVTNSENIPIEAKKNI